MKIAITGISGYMGGLLTHRLLSNSSVESILGIDIKQPNIEHQKFSFLNCDIRDKALVHALKGYDTVVHLAFIVQEIKDKKLIYDINLNGTKNVLDACEKNKPRKLIVASSVAAYGCVKRDYVITEESPLQGNKASYYSDTKRIVEGMLDEFEKNNSKIIITRMRPSIFCGKHINNFFRDIVKFPIITYVTGNPYGFPIVYENDVADAFYTVTVEDHHGAFNIHTGSLTVKRTSELLNKKAIGISFRPSKILADIGFKLNIMSFSSHWVELARYPFEISTEKAKKILHFKPTKTAEEAFIEMVESLNIKPSLSSKAQA